MAEKGNKKIFWINFAVSVIPMVFIVFTYIASIMETQKKVNKLENETVSKEMLDNKLESISIQLNEMKEDDAEFKQEMKDEMIEVKEELRYIRRKKDNQNNTATL